MLLQAWYNLNQYCVILMCALNIKAGNIFKHTEWKLSYTQYNSEIMTLYNYKWSAMQV